ncbi:MAG: hypothetical protein KDA81_07300 [Planctomycetaceae bacterium]|nr:hypothetical protein [Planctomycetaceae bacterium]
MTELLLLHVLLTCFMTGLIWFVQIVHYPMFADVGRTEFSSYEIRHNQRTTWIVAPIMIAELATGMFIAVRIEGNELAAAVGVGLILMIWLSTAVLQVPEHRRLMAGFDARSWRRLVLTNWIRTSAWTVRAFLTLHIVRDQLLH